LENMVTNAAIKQSNISHFSKHSLFPEKERLLFNNKQISLREKLILWTDKHKIEQKSLTALLSILRSEGHDNLPPDGRTLMNTPRSTILYKRSGGYYYYYGLQNGIIDNFKQLNTLIRHNVVYINLQAAGIQECVKMILWGFFPCKNFLMDRIYGSTKRVSQKVPCRPRGLWNFIKFFFYFYQKFWHLGESFGH